MAINQLGDGNPDGVQLPDTKLGFYAVTPIAQRTGSAQATFTITIGTSETAWGFKTSDQFNAFVLQMREIQDTMIALGLWAGA